MTAVDSRQFEPPLNLPTPDRSPELAILGHAVFRGTRRRFGLLADDRRRHMMLLGKTGQGKTSLLQQLIGSDIAAGRGVAVLDPHGDLSDAILDAIPKHRTSDVICFDVADTQCPIAFNPLTCPNRQQRPLVASGVLSAFKKLYGEFFGPRMEHIFRNALLAVLETPDASLVTLLRLLNDAPYRTRLVHQLTDPAVKAFWTTEFLRMPPKLQAEALGPVLNKIGHFVSSPALRHILGQANAKLNLRTVMDQGKVLIVNLSKGKVGDDASALLGSLLVTAIQLAAMSRADIPEEKRQDFCLYIDEFQNFATESFATILSEARKYRLALTCANQFLSQLDEDTLAAVFGNIGTLACFQVGAQDAELLTKQLGTGMTEQDLLALPRYYAYIRLLIDGMPSRPFSMQTLPPANRRADPQRAALIRRLSRQAYGRPLAKVEAEIAQAFALGT